MAKVYLLGKTVSVDGSNNAEKLGLFACNLYEDKEESIQSIYKQMSDREIAASYNELEKEDKKNLYYCAGLFTTFVFGIENLSWDSIHIMNDINPIYDHKIKVLVNDKFTVLNANAVNLLDFFKEACCSKYGAELNDVASQMLDICLDEAPNLFKDAGAPCTFGKCKKVFSCGEKRNAKVKQIIKTY